METTGLPAGRPRPTALNVARYEEATRIAGLPDDPRVVLVSTSERTDATCPARWRYRYGLGLGGKASGVMRYGSAWHEVVEDVHRWWMATGGVEYADDYLRACAWCSTRGVDPACERCGGSGAGPVERIASRWQADALSGVDPDAEDEDKEPVERRVDRLYRAATGWLLVNGRAPPAGYEVAAVEFAVACPVREPGSLAPYSPTIPLAPVPGGWRVARPGDDPSSVRTVRWPWYWVGRIDAVYRRIATGELLAVEVKSTRDPAGYLAGVTIDPQTVGYVAMLAHAVACGAIDGRVSGWMFDIASSSYQYDPEPLKSGGLSLAMSRTVPSWRWRAAVAARQAAGLVGARDDLAAYAAHEVALAERVDPRLYLREWSAVGDVDLARWRAECHAVARELADLRRALPLAGEEPVAVASAFPRRPVCRLPGGNCSFRGPCAADGPDARRRYPVDDEPRWLDPRVSLPVAVPAVTTNEEKECVSWL